MNYIITEEKLIDYLYGEMSQDESIQFQVALEQSPKWQRELDEMKELHNKLSTVQDERPPQQIIIKEHIQKKLINLRWLRPLGVVAAGIALFMVLGNIFGIQIDKYDGGMSISFNPSAATPQELNLNNEEIQSLVNQILDQRDHQWSQQLVDWQEDLKIEVRNQEESIDAVATQVKNINKRPNTNFVTLSEMNQVMQKQRREDQDDYEKMVANLFEYLSLSRDKDLQMIQQGFEDIKQYINLSELERNQILASYQDNYLNQ